MQVEIHSIRSLKKLACRPFSPGICLISIGDVGQFCPQCHSRKALQLLSSRQGGNSAGQGSSLPEPSSLQPLCPGKNQSRIFAVRSNRNFLRFRQRGRQPALPLLPG